MIRGYEDGANLTIMNTFYSFPKKQNDGKWDKGSITIVYRDNDTGEKKVQVFEDPMYTIYKAKDGVNFEYREIFAKKELLEPVTVPYRNLDREIAAITGNERFYKENIQNGNRSANKRLHTCNNMFFSDMDIEDKYRFEFARRYTNITPDITKAFFDIEVNIKNMKGDFPEPGECPINAISYINPADDTIYSLLLREPDNPLIQEFEDEVNNNYEALHAELKDLIRYTVKGYKQEIRYGLKDTKIKFLFYDNEIELIQDLFNLVNFFRPDFLLAWNMAFDIPYIIQRIINLGYNPEDIMCHPDFPHKIVKYKVDDKDYQTGQRKEFGKRGDRATIASYTIFLDQLIQFASRRRGQAQFQSNKLDYIGQVVAKVRKLDYSHITTSLAKLPYLNYKIFVFYNIIDTIVQKCVETKINDVDYIFNKCLINNTRYDKGHRQVTYLTNRFTHELYKSGYIVGNNSNKFKPKPEEKYDGAYVADPLHLNDYSKKKINNIPVNVYDNTIDFDYKAQYPNELREHNMAPWTQIGQVIIPEAIYKKENPFNSPKYKRGGAFLDDMMTKNYLEFCHRYLHLASYEELLNDIMEYHMEIQLGIFDTRRYYDGDKLNIMIKVKNDNKLNIMYKLKENDPSLMRVMTKVTQRPSCYNEVLSKINIDEVVYDERRSFK